MRQACGNVKSFKRLITPANKPQGFGFAEFEDPDGALRAMALLNNVELPALEDGCVNKKLLVRLRAILCTATRIHITHQIKADEKTKMFLDAYQTQRMQTNVRRSYNPDQMIPLCGPVAHIRAWACWQHVYVAIGSASLSACYDLPF
jgi:hypothetical protein